MRKLASVQRVVDVMPIPGADNIELVQVLGWQCVVKRGEFKPGDLGVYFEIDSVVPADGPFDFLKSRRIKTIKLRGQLSQGLMLPIQTFGFVADENLHGCVAENDDLTDVLKVEKYDPHPVNSNGANLSFKRPSDFPSDVPKTDEERVQSAPFLLRRLAGKPYVITLKMDGGSATYTMHEGKFTVCSRNYIVPESDENESSLYWRVFRKYENALRAITDPQSSLFKYYEDPPFYAVQGEICAPGLQKNRTGVPDGDVQFYVFNLFDRQTQRYEDYFEMERVCKHAGLPVVPWLKTNTSFDYTQASLLELAEGKYDGTNNEREGLVVRSLDTSPANRVSFKVISNRYLLKGGE